MTTITVSDITRDEIIAQSDDPLLLEGGYYFEPDQVVLDHLIVTQRTYTCPYKGICQWIDLEGPAGIIRDVGWTYTRPRSGYEYIQDKIAFAYGLRPGIAVTKT
jgi:uncharacterized protein (DUF427 family)